MPVAQPFLASPIKRIIAAAIDLAITFIALVLLMAAFSGLSGEAIFCVVVALQIAFLWHWNGGSPGRVACAIRVVSALPGGELGLMQIVARSSLRLALVYATGWFAARVIKDNEDLIVSIALLPVILDLLLVSMLPWRQSIADFLFKTVVVNMPTPEPHRAPAGPMYSESDAEFGSKPRWLK